MKLGKLGMLGLICFGWFFSAHSQSNRDWASDPKSVKTVKRAGSALFKLDVLKAVSTQCGNTEYFKEELVSQLSQLVTDKLHLSLDSFRQIMLKEQGLKELLEKALADVNCQDVEDNDTLYYVYQDFDDALFDLDNAYALDAPFTSNQEFANEQVKTLQEGILALTKSAKRIAIGTIVTPSQVPNKFRKKLSNSTKLVFKTERGWKEVIEAYFPIIDTSRENAFVSSFASEEEKQQLQAAHESGRITHYIGKKVLIFVDKFGYFIQDWVPVESEYYSYYSATLGIHDWEYSGLQVHKNREKIKDNF